MAENEVWDEPGGSAGMDICGVPRASRDHHMRGRGAAQLPLRNPARETLISSMPNALPCGAGPRERIRLPRSSHCHLGIATLYRRTDQGLEREHLTTAATMYRKWTSILAKPSG